MVYIVKWYRTLWFFFNFFFNIYLFLGQRETEHERARGRQRGRHRMGNRLQALSHQPRAWRGAQTPGPRDRDLAEVGRLTNWATQAPQLSASFKFVSTPLHITVSLSNPQTGLLLPFWYHLWYPPQELPPQQQSHGTPRCSLNITIVFLFLGFYSRIFHFDCPSESYATLPPQRRYMSF